MAAGGGMVYWKNWIRLRDAKKHTTKAFSWFKCDLISQWIPKCYLCDESTPINPQCGKISVNFYISPPHPPHPQFYPQKWWKFRYTSWLTKTNCISIDLRGAQVNNARLPCCPAPTLTQQLTRASEMQGFILIIHTSNGSWRQGIKGEMTCTVYVALVWNIIYWIMMIITLFTE